MCLCVRILVGKDISVFMCVFAPLLVVERILVAVTTSRTLVNTELESYLNITHKI